MARINLAVDAGIAQDLMDEARRQNKTLYAVANEAIQTYLHIARMGKNPEQIYKIVEAFEFLRAISAVPVPETLLDKILQVAFKNAREDVLHAWYEEGRVFGELVKPEAGKIDDLGGFVKRFGELLPVGHIELNVLDDKVEVILAGTGYSAESAACTSEGLRGFLEAFNLKVERVETASGFVKIEAQIST